MTLKEFMDSFKDNKTFAIAIIAVFVLAWAVSHAL